MRFFLNFLNFFKIYYNIVIIFYFSQTRVNFYLPNCHRPVCFSLPTLLSVPSPKNLHAVPIHVADVAPVRRTTADRRRRSPPTRRRVVPIFPAAARSPDAIPPPPTSSCPAPPRPVPCRSPRHPGPPSPQYDLYRINFNFRHSCKNTSISLLPV